MIVLIDTSIFCNVIAIPGYDQDRDRVVEQFRAYIDKDASLLLPLVSILEAGNFIGHLKDGRVRRQWAERLREVSIEAIDGSAPWTPTPFPDREQFLEILSGFRDAASRGCGLVDQSILFEKKRLSAMNPQRKVVIWTLDEELAAYSDP